LSSEVFTIGTALKSIRALARAESYYLSMGYDPVEAVTMIYDRALRYYDSVFPEDEVEFRTMLVNRRERRLKWAYNERRRETASGDGSEDSPET
jgi:ABC-type anion transport system duplicated permease subunit